MYDPATERWACPSYLLPDGTVNFHAFAPMAPTSPGGGAGAPQQLLRGSLAFTPSELETELLGLETGLEEAVVVQLSLVLCLH